MQAFLLKIAAALLLSLTLAALAVGLYQTRETLSLTRTQLDEQKLAVQLLRDQQQATAATVLRVLRTSQQTKASVKVALDAEPSFRDAAVPAGVAQRLCERLSCTP